MSREQSHQPGAFTAQLGLTQQCAPSQKPSASIRPGVACRGQGKASVFGLQYTCTVRASKK